GPAEYTSWPGSAARSTPRCPGSHRCSGGSKGRSISMGDSRGHRHEGSGEGAEGAVRCEEMGKSARESENRGSHMQGYRISSVSAVPLPSSTLLSILWTSAIVGCSPMPPTVLGPSVNPQGSRSVPCVPDGG